MTREEYNDKVYELDRLVQLVATTARDSAGKVLDYFFRDNSLISHRLFRKCMAIKGDAEYLENRIGLVISKTTRPRFLEVTDRATFLGEIERVGSHLEDDLDYLWKYPGLADASDGLITGLFLNCGLVFARLEDIGHLLEVVTRRENGKEVA